MRRRRFRLGDCERFGAVCAATEPMACAERVVRFADRRDADRRYADRCRADRRHTDRRYADRCRADRRHTDRRYADRCCADRRHADHRIPEHHHAVSRATSPRNSASGNACTDRNACSERNACTDRVAERSSGIHAVALTKPTNRLTPVQSSRGSCAPS